MSARFDDELYCEILEYAKERGIPKNNGAQGVCEGRD